MQMGHTVRDRDVTVVSPHFQRKVLLRQLLSKPYGTLCFVQDRVGRFNLVGKVRM